MRHRGDQHHERREHHERAALVARDLLVHAHGGALGGVGRGRDQNWTATGPCSPGSPSKYSRGVKLNMPARRFAGNVWMLVVVAQHAVVVELPRVGDPVLGRGELLLQVQEVLVRLEVRVRLGHREQALQRTAQDVLGLGLRAGRGRSAR